jgi:L-aspartate oxidase
VTSPTRGEVSNRIRILTNHFSQHGKKREFDVIVIGSGIAGISYILNLLELNPKLNIALISKKNLAESNSQYAQGGIAGVIVEGDSVEQHINDTLKSGDGLCNEKAVREILTAAPHVLLTLHQRGVIFDKELGQEGGHSERRIYHVGDQTGKAIMTSLLEKLSEQKQVTIFEFHTAVNLITQNKPHTPSSPREVIGVYVLNEKTKKIDTFVGKIVALATGGAGKVYRYTSNPETATGDGIAMAYRAGARVENMEFYQFHPTVLYHHKLNNFLMTEALRGEGAYLLNADTHERFMKHYAPKQMELATRDVVARAIFTEIERSEKNFVYLDIRHKDRDFLQQHFPNIFATLLELGIDMSKDLIPVVPAAHYLCGGILTDVAGHTDIKRLYALGETAFTGLHGANRLASNSLLEGAVMPYYAAQESIKELEEPLILHREILGWSSESVIDLRRASQINAHWRGLRSEMTSYAGIVRTEAGLKDLLRLIQYRREIIETYYWKHIITTDLIELRNIALIAELITTAALQRRESRGGHCREDYPKKLSEAQASVLQYDENRLV